MPKPRLRNNGRVESFRARFGRDASRRRAHEDRVAAIRAGNKLWMRDHRLHDTTHGVGSVVREAGWIGELCQRLCEGRKRQCEIRCRTPIDAPWQLSLDAREFAEGLRHRLLHRMAVLFVAFGSHIPVPRQP